MGVEEGQNLALVELEEGRVSYRIVMEAERGYFYWPFWPFRRKLMVLDLPSGFKIHVDQVDGRHLSGEPVTVSGYVSTDKGVITTNVDFNNGSRLKRITKRA